MGLSHGSILRHFVNQVLGRLESPLIQALPYDTINFNPLHPDLTLAEGEDKIMSEEEIELENSSEDEDDVCGSTALHQGP